MNIQIVEKQGWHKLTGVVKFPKRVAAQSGLSAEANTFFFSMRGTFVNVMSRSVIDSNMLKNAGLYDG